MRIKLDEDRKQEIIHALIGFHVSEFDEEISAYRAEQVVDFLLRRIGPTQYNQAIADARKFMAEKLDDLDAEFFEPEEK